MSASTSRPDLREEVGKPGTNFRQVGPGEKSKLSPLMKHYGKMAHPFTACVRDNRKRFGDRAEKVCAVLKDLIKGTTKWRNTEEAMGALLEAAGGDVNGLVEMYRDDLARRLDAVVEHLGPEATILVLYEHKVEEAVLTAKGRKQIPEGSFAIPPDRYPIHDLAHARNALARSSGKPEEGRVRAAVYSRYPALRKRVKEGQEELRREIADLAEAYKACPGEPNALIALIGMADKLAARADPFELAEGEQAILLELSLRSLRGGARDYARVGGGHGRKSGRFSKREIAALGKPGGMRDVSAMHAPTGMLARARHKANVKVAGGEFQASVRQAATPEYARARDKASKAGAAERLRPSVKRRGGGPTGLGPGVTPPKGAGKLWSDAEKEIPAALRQSPEWKAALAEAEKHTDRMAEGKWNVNDSREIYTGIDKAEAKAAKVPGKTRRAEIYTGERADLHKRAMALMFQGTKKQPKGKREALFMAGGGAAGKSSLLRDKHVATPEASTLINADLWKLALPDEELLRDPSRPDATRKKAAGKVHEESSTLSKRHMQLARDRGVNFIMDGTGDGDPGKLRGQLDDAKAKGFDVRLAYATTYVSDAIERNEPRYEKSGRYVDPGIIEDAHVSAAKAFTSDVLPSDYPFEIWDTGSKPPTLIARRDSGKGKEAVKISEDAAWQRFLARANGPDTRPKAEARNPEPAAV